MFSTVKTRAYANIALVKYWGKQTTGINCPATPSLSLAVDALMTETEIRRSRRDGLVYNGATVTDISEIRIFKIIRDWKNRGLLEGHFLVDTRNGFPSGAGLASSASGVAALTAGLNRLTETALDDETLNRLTRQGSGSAARSLTGGLSVLPDDADPWARQIIPPEDVPWCIVAAVTDLHSKKVGSRQAMEICRETSPYYDDWIKTARRDFAEMLEAVDRRDFSHVGEITERNCLAMHACMWAARPALMYWNETTVKIIRAVKSWRDDGLEAYFTIDAGPQVCLLTGRDRAEYIAEKVRELPGVKQVLIGYPAGGAEVVSCT